MPDWIIAYYVFEFPYHDSKGRERLKGYSATEHMFPVNKPVPGMLVQEKKTMGIPTIAQRVRGFYAQQSLQAGAPNAGACTGMQLG